MAGLAQTLEVPISPSASSGPPKNGSEAPPWREVRRFQHALTSLREDLELLLTMRLRTSSSRGRLRDFLLQVHGITAKETHVGRQSSREPSATAEQHRLADEVLETIAVRLKAAGNRPHLLFTKLDKDCSGRLDRAEVEPVLTAIHPDMSVEEKDAIFAKFDIDGGGSVELHEFVEALERARPPRHLEPEPANGFAEEELAGRNAVEVVASLATTLPTSPAAAQPSQAEHRNEARKAARVFLTETFARLGTQAPAGGGAGTPPAAGGVSLSATPPADELEMRTPSKDKRPAPPPLEEVCPQDEPPSSPRGADDPGELVEAMRFGLQVQDGGRTSQAIFETFAAAVGEEAALIAADRFEAVVAMYSGRSPAIMGSTALARDLFDDLAITTQDDRRGVPFDLFCAELCPEKEPEAVLRIASKQQALLQELRRAVLRKGKAAARLLEEAAPIGAADFAGCVEKLLGAPPAAKPDPVAVQAVWRQLVRGKQAADRRASISDVWQVLFSDVSVIPSDDEDMMPYEVFVSEFCPDVDKEAAQRAQRLGQDLLRSLQEAAAGPRSPTGPASPARGSKRVSAFLSQALSSAATPLDEEAFKKIVHEALGSPHTAAPYPTAVKALWCSLTRGGHTSERHVDPKELLGKIGVTTAHTPTKDVSDDELELSQSGPGTVSDSNIELITPFATPTTRPLLPAMEAVAQAMPKAEPADAKAKPKPKVAALAAAIVDSPSDVGRYVDLAEALEGEDSVEVGGETYTQKELLLKAVGLDPNCSRALSDLGCILGNIEGGAVTVDGREYTEKELYVRAIECDASVTGAYENLIAALGHDEKVTIAGQEHDRVSLKRKQQQAAGGRDLWGFMAKDAERGSLVSAFDAARAAKEAEGSPEASPLPGPSGPPAAARDLWTAVADDIEDHTLRGSLSTPSADAAPEDLWSKVAEDVESRRLLAPLRSVEEGSPLQDVVDGSSAGRAGAPAPLRGANGASEVRPPAISPSSASHVTELESRLSPLGDSMLLTLRPADLASTPLGSASADMPPVARKTLQRKLTGKSPLFRAKDVDRVFQDADADGDGVLGLEDLRMYLGDYLCYGDAEVTTLYETRGAGVGLKVDAFKDALQELNPYSIAKKSQRLIVRKPTAFGGMDAVDFRIADCNDCTILVCDRASEVSADCLKNCLVLVGPCPNSTFLRNCEDCTFWVACKQLRTRDCKRCTIYLHAHTEPVIETSTEMSFAPFAAQYPGLTKHFADAGFDPNRNFWSAVFDFNGSKDEAHWRIQPLEECENLVVSFVRCSEAPDSPAPVLSQELLLAPPPVSQEDHGGSMNIPQTRPRAPPAPPPGAAPRCRRIVDSGGDAGRSGTVAHRSPADDNDDDQASSRPASPSGGLVPTPPAARSGRLAGRLVHRTAGGDEDKSVSPAKRSAEEELETQ